MKTAVVIVATLVTSGVAMSANADVQVPVVLANCAGEDKVLNASHPSAHFTIFTLPQRDADTTPRQADCEIGGKQVSVSIKDIETGSGVCRDQLFWTVEISVDSQAQVQSYSESKDCTMLGVGKPVGWVSANQRYFEFCRRGLEIETLALGNSVMSTHTMRCDSFPLNTLNSLTVVR